MYICLLCAFFFFFEKKAFDIGKQVLKTDLYGDSLAQNESQKFRLLPEDKPHDVVLFPNTKKSELKKQQILDLQLSNDPSCNNGSLPMGTKINVMQDRSTKKALRSFGHPPDPWVGRYLDIFQLIKCIQDPHNRFTIIFGDKGMGKSALMNRTFEYLWERRKFDGVFVIDIYKTLRENATSSIAEIISNHLREAKVNMKPCTTNADLVNELRNRKYLIGIENIDAFSVRHLHRRQRVDECLFHLCQETRVRLVATMATVINNEHLPLLQRIVPSTIKLKPMTDEELLEIFWAQMKKTH
ncbi:hypothetical protein RFI_08826, partial [Reticulomyxa filosa]